MESMLLLRGMLFWLSAPFDRAQDRLRSCSEQGSEGPRVCSTRKYLYFSKSVSLSLFVLSFFLIWASVLNAASFSEQYLERYYPKAVVIGEEFLKMSPDQVEAALGEIVELIATKPWYYFQNKKDGFNVKMNLLTLLAEQMIICIFLESAYVDRRKNKLFLAPSLPRDLCTPLLKYWKDQGRVKYQEFYAQHFDYLVKLFNQAVLEKNLPSASLYMLNMNQVIRKLAGSKYEQMYIEKIKQNKELLSMLRVEIERGNYEA